MESAGPETLRYLVKKGVGLTFLNPLDVIMECKRGELVFRSAHRKLSPPPAHEAVCPSRATLDTATSLFIEFLLAELTDIVADL